jgi:hypothetical protein
MKSNPRYPDLYSGFPRKPRISSFVIYRHPNPRFYKYTYRVFHGGSPEGKAFFSETPELSVYETQELTNQLKALNQGFMIYNYQYPRDEPTSPLDLSHPRWRNCKIAPNYDDDPDIEIHGCK